MFGKVAETPQNETHAVPSAQPVRRGQGLRVLDDRELPRGVRPLRRERHPLQSRVAAARRDVRHAQDHARGRPHQARPAGPALPRQPRREARLGLREGLRRSDVADAAAGRARTTTSSPPARRTPCASSASARSRAPGIDDRMARRADRRTRRRARHRPRARRDRSALPPADRSRPAARRRLEGEGKARLDAAHDVSKISSI